MRPGPRIDRPGRRGAASPLELGRGLRLAPGLLRRILLWALPFPVLSALSLYLRQPAFTTVFPLVFGAFVVLWQVFAYGASGGRITPEQLAATNFYPKRALVFIAAFWTVLIAAVSVALWLKVHPR